MPDDLRFQQVNLPSEEFVGLKGYKIHLDRYPKEGAKCKVLLVHGGGGNGRILGTLAVGLKSLGCEWIAPDLPGFGLTKIPDDKRYVPYEDWVLVLNDLVQKEKNQVKNFSFLD
ncbi:hypothetical protein P3G55_01625 [Leptospira sp. 96542]|nr:hypothetical protein [Leptospira sp. 96542]